MSSPDTNTQKQARRHRGPLIGIAGAAVFAFIIAVVWVGGFMGDDATGDAENVNPVSQDAG